MSQTTPKPMTRAHALHSAAEILETEANELAMFLDRERRDDRVPSLPPRVRIAIKTEMNRLRNIAIAIRPKQKPQPDDED